jgi:hypothetical protein
MLACSTIACASTHDQCKSPGASSSHESATESVSEPSSAESDCDDDDEDEDEDYLDNMEHRFSEDQDGDGESDRKRRRLDDCAESLSHCCLDSQSRQVLMERTLIIFDWDDTLLPSSWLLAQDLKIVANARLPNDAEKLELRRVSRSVVKTLRRAKRIGTVMIITNAEKGWVELTCRHFMPEVAPLLEGLKILSARSKFEPSWPSVPLQWKRLAFQLEVGAFFQGISSRSVAGARENVISIGDSLHEREALIRATESRYCWKKSIKFLDQPSSEQLVKQHEHLSLCLSTLVRYGDNVDLRLHIDKESEPTDMALDKNSIKIGRMA